MEKDIFGERWVLVKVESGIRGKRGGFLNQKTKNDCSPGETGTQCQKTKRVKNCRQWMDLLVLASILTQTGERGPSNSKGSGNGQSKNTEANAGSKSY